MIIGLIPLSFRFRGKLRRIAEIYRCFLEHPGIGLHPTQISRFTGLGFGEVNSRLDATPELFVKLPRRPDGITRYRLTTTITVKTPEEVEKFLAAAARKESFILYAMGIMLLCIMLIVVILIGPTL